MLPAISYILPTRNRPECLARTLSALGALPSHTAEVIIIDNASEPPASVPFELPNGFPVTLLLRSRNDGAAARNSGARAASPSSKWLVMLDDDSHPLNLNFLQALAEQPPDVAALCAEIFLPPRTSPLCHSATSPLRESGGLPEIPIGCGVAYRREVFLSAEINGTTGYDPTFGFYAEEYDLAARLIRAGHRIVMDRRFAVLHEKTPAGRSMDTILRRLVRNNAWVMRRYAPSTVRHEEVKRVLSRYARIAWKERALGGYLAGLGELSTSLSRQPRAELSMRHWQRFTGHAACRRSLLNQWATKHFTTAALIHRGKNDHIVQACLEEIGVRITSDPQSAEALVIATLSPGPMLDAHALHATEPRIIVPWDEPLAAAPHAQTTVAQLRDAA
jgi:GT2 family glycosyltransferase